MERHKIYYKGEGGDFPQVWAVVSLVSPSCPWLVLAPKVLQLCTNHLVLVLCRFVWVVEACQFFLVPSWSSNTPLYPSKVLRARERAPILYSFVIFSLDSHLSPSRSWEHVSLSGCLYKYWHCSYHCWHYKWFHSTLHHFLCLYIYVILFFLHTWARVPPSSTLLFFLRTLLKEFATTFFLFSSVVYISSLVFLTLVDGFYGFSFWCTNK
jgi:hypothetical protein